MGMLREPIIRATAAHIDHRLTEATTDPTDPAGFARRYGYRGARSDEGGGGSVTFPPPDGPPPLSPSTATVAPANAGASSFGSPSGQWTPQNPAAVPVAPPWFRPRASNAQSAVSGFDDGVVSDYAEPGHRLETTTTKDGEGDLRDLRGNVLPPQREINPTFFKNWQDAYWTNPKAVANKARHKLYWSTNDPYHAILHELGHTLHCSQGSAMVRKLSNIRDFGVLDNDIVSELSNRATQNGHEFVAEMFAKTMLGDPITNPKVLAKYKELGGIEMNK